MARRQSKQFGQERGYSRNSRYKIWFNSKYLKLYILSMYVLIQLCLDLSVSHSLFTCSHVSFQQFAWLCIYHFRGFIGLFIRLFQIQTQYVHTYRLFLFYLHDDGCRVWLFLASFLSSLFLWIQSVPSTV